MKGVILAGGLGKRLYPLTKVTNKHLLPVYHQPMIFYPLGTLLRAQVRDILIVTGGTSAGDFLRLLGNGQDFGARLYYAYQEGEKGIAQALSLAEDFTRGDRVVVILGDNIVEEDITPYVQRFKEQKQGTRLLLKKVSHPERFGVVEFEGRDNGRILKIHEKPKRPKSDFIVTGIYLYDTQVFDIIRTLKMSDRGELEITDVNNAYLKRGELEYDFLKGFWTDAGTFDSLLTANQLARRMSAGSSKQMRPVEASLNGRVRAGRVGARHVCV